MDLLQAGVDSTTIALWLGHQSIETTLAMKEEALARITHPVGKPGCYQADDSLLAFLGKL